MGRMQLTAALTVVMALVLGTLLTACTAAPIMVDSGLDLGVPGAAIETVPGVPGYPACGTEPIAHGGTTWYPFRPSNIADFPALTAAPAPTGGLGGGTMHAALPAVAAPGPGDDVGTLTIYEGGFAYWISDSGRIETWLTDQPLEYAWVC